MKKLIELVELLLIEDVGVDPYEDDGEDSAACIYYNETFKESLLILWICCQQYNKCCHNDCAKILRTSKQFACELCS